MRFPPIGIAPGFARRTRRQRSFRREIAMVCVAALSLACSPGGDGGRDEPGEGAPIASFTETQTTGLPGVAIQFNDTSTGEIGSYAWDFGTLGTSTDPNPMVVFPVVGTYSIGLTVTGTRGTSTVLKPALIEIAELPTAGFACVPTQGFAPLTVACTDNSSGGDESLLDFGDGSTSDQASLVHIYSDPGTYAVEQTVTSAGGVVQVSDTIEVHPFVLSASATTGSAPLESRFIADVGGLVGTSAWTVDRQLVGGTPIIVHTFNNPGTYEVEFVFAFITDPPEDSFAGVQSFEVVVGYGPASAAFTPKPSDGNGPLDVEMLDDSVGAIDKWEWDFGDGTTCVYPADPDPDSMVFTCDSSSPTHTYDRVGRYDVSLTVTGPSEDGNPSAILSTTNMVNAVTVYIADPSFESQTVGSAVSGAWTHLRPSDELESAQHIALSDAQQTDGGMPTEGSNWVVLDGLGTDGLTPTDLIENGIRQDLLMPADRPVLEFDYALLYSEAPIALVLDAVTATVSVGETTVEISSARADVSSPYAGSSVVYPTRDGNDVRMTPTLTASINLADAFPGSTSDTLFTLTVRTGNLDDEFRSPLVYLDNFRFVESASVLAAKFSVDQDPLIAGQPATFSDESCLDPEAGLCSVPTSWRWDFDTQRLTNPPSASGSGEQNPSYAFPEAGTYDVRMVARLADLQSSESMLVTVIGAPMASFSFDIQLHPPPPSLARAIVTFTDESTADEIDKVASWSWDFGRWGTSLDEAPAPVAIGQAGNWAITLTVTTLSGQTDTVQMVVTVF